MRDGLLGVRESGPEGRSARRALEAGAQLFDAGERFAAHEVWEERWRAARGSERLLLQGLILAAAALLQHDRGVARGAASLWRRGRAKLEAACAEAAAAPLDVAAFARGMDAALAGAAPPPRLVPLLRGTG